MPLPATRIATQSWINALRIGLIGGVCAVLIALIGMIEVFSKRSIIAGVIDMGALLMLGLARGDAVRLMPRGA